MDAVGTSAVKYDCLIYRLPTFDIAIADNRIALAVIVFFLVKRVSSLLAALTAGDYDSCILRCNYRSIWRMIFSRIYWRCHT